MDVLNSKRVIVVRQTDARYPDPPFHPSENYPEYAFKGQISSSRNSIYDMVRNLLYAHGYDIENFGAPQWNPLGFLIKPGDRVLLKPNLVRHYHPYNMDVFSIFTHGSIIRAVLDFVFIALKGSGEVIIGDAPLQSCDFDQIKQLNGLNHISDFYSKKGFNIKLSDFRLVKATADRSSLYGRILTREGLFGDPLGYTKVDLGKNSMHYSLSDRTKNFRVTCYDPREMSKHHNQNVHEYIIANAILKSDVIINLPKMKTHHKAGVTGALKNLIGINGHKDWLPHHTKGSKAGGGDEYLNESAMKRFHSWIIDHAEASSNKLTRKILYTLQRLTYRGARAFSKDPFFEGSWWGNDTIWRTTLDLNKILLYADKDGKLTQEPGKIRKVLHIVDGIIAGEKDGPLAPTPRNCGVIIGGMNPVAVDTVMARMMGFNYLKISLIKNAYQPVTYPLVNFPPDDISILLSIDSQLKEYQLSQLFNLNFKPHYGWANYVEL